MSGPTIKARIYKKMLRLSPWVWLLFSTYFLGACSQLLNIPNSLSSFSNLSITAPAQTVNAVYNAGAPITLAVTGVGTASVTYTIISDPLHGTLSGTPPVVSYTPNSGFVGTDSFSFQAKVGGVVSNVATISITVSADNIIAAKNDNDTQTEQGTGLSKALTVNVTSPATFPSTVLSPIIGDYAQISAGNYTTCAITTAGVLQCWGYNDAGQVGDGTITTRLSPVTIGSGYAKVSTNGSSTCAITTAGVLQCWGYNGFGQIGDGTYSNRLSPVTIGSGYAQLSLGDATTCAITTAGVLKCWGNNSAGQVGDGTITTRLSPVTIGSGYAQVSTGEQTTCAITTAGVLQCWGYNNDGQVGDGTTTNRLSPVTIGSGYAQVSEGDYTTCAITTGDDLQCWGDNAIGELGDGTTTNRLSPVTIGSGYAQVAGNFLSTCAITTAGVLQCWGYNIYGQIGDGTVTTRLSPVTVGSGYAQVSEGNFSTCAITTGDTLKCWGYNIFGQLGTGSTANKHSPPNIASCVVNSVSGDLTSDISGGNPSCSCDGGVCTMTYDTTVYNTGAGSIHYTITDGTGNFSDTGVLNVTVNPIPNTIVASSTDSDNQPFNTVGIAKYLSVIVTGDQAIFPDVGVNSGTCTVNSTSGDLSNASCTCDGTNCIMNYDTTSYNMGTGQISYTVLDGSGQYSSTGFLSVGVASYLFTASITDTDTESENTGPDQITLTVVAEGTAIFPNTGMALGSCSINSISGDLSSANCTCDGSSCIMSYWTSSYNTGTGQVSYSVTDGSNQYISNGLLTITVTP